VCKLAGFRTAAFPQNRNLKKNTDYVETMILKDLRDLRFSCVTLGLLPTKRVTNGDHWKEGHALILMFLTGPICFFPDLRCVC
jgi:hypothetical protein